MYEHGYLVKYATPSYPHQLYWQPVCAGNMPPEGRFVWAFVPEIGNEDEGYGYIMLARTGFFGRGEWYNEQGEEMGHEPVFWASLWSPDDDFVPYDSPEEARRRVGESREKIVQCTGPWSRFQR
jgi:hypothetical protein